MSVTYTIENLQNTCDSSYNIPTLQNNVPAPQVIKTGCKPVLSVIVDRLRERFWRKVWSSK